MDENENLKNNELTLFFFFYDPGTVTVSEIQVRAS